MDPRQTHRPSGHQGHGGHRLMMLLMCLPMLVVVGFLVLTDVVGPGAFLAVIVCVGAMALMHGAAGGQGHR